MILSHNGQYSIFYKPLYLTLVLNKSVFVLSHYSLCLLSIRRNKCGLRTDIENTQKMQCAVANLQTKWFLQWRIRQICLDTISMLVDESITKLIINTREI